jgi:hypothetical protein
MGASYVGIKTLFRRITYVRPHRSFVVPIAFISWSLVFGPISDRLSLICGVSESLVFYRVFKSTQSA